MLMVRENQENLAKQVYSEFTPDINVRDNDGKNIIHHIVSPMVLGYYQNEKLLNFFALAGADVNCQDNFGQAPIYYASQQ